MPPVSNVPPAFTVAVMVNTDPLAALVGVTVKVVVVWATATTQDSAINNPANKEVREFLRSAVLRLDFA